MRGRIIHRQKSSYTIVLSLDRDYKTGKRKQKWISVKGLRRNAEKLLSELEHQYQTTGIIDSTNLTVSQFLDKWLATYKLNLTVRTFERYDNIIHKHLIPDIGKYPLTKLRPEHLQSHYSKMLTMGLKSPTVHYHHTVIHVALASAVKWGLVGRNVADAVDAPPNTRIEMMFWDGDELNQFLESAKNNPYYTLFYLALFTGMRRSEILGLHWSDIDLLGAQLSVRRSLHQVEDRSYIYSDTKTAKSKRTIALTPSTVIVLREYLKGKEPLPDRLVFCHADGKPLRPLTVSRAWHNACVRAGVKVIRFHDARHTHATILLKQGIHPKIVQERLGHSNISTTLDTYSHVVPGLQELAAKAFDEVITVPLPLNR
jgi:integrase